MIVEEGEELELENIIKGAQEGAETAESAAQYGKPLDEIYQMATPTVYDTIKDLRNRASEGHLSEYEQSKINFYENQFEQVTSVEVAYVQNKDRRIDIMKIKTALEQIKEYESRID